MNYFGRAALLVILSVNGSLNSLPTGEDLFYDEASEDFIIRWGFQNLCNHVFDPRTGVKDQPSTTLSTGLTFDPQEVQPGDTIFVRKINLFMQTMHDKISVPYIMVSHGDFLDTCKEEDIDYLDDEKIIAWFSIHPPKRFHAKFHPLPLGISQKEEHYMQRSQYADLFKKLRKKPKTHLVAITFDGTQNPEREKVLEILKDKTFCFNPGEVNFETYMETLGSSKFALSPRGWGPDCYRTWEALLAGSIPIVSRGEHGVMRCAEKYLRSNFGLRSSNKHLSNLDSLYENLPILVVNDWSEITEEFLEKKYAEITFSKYSMKRLHIDYWRKKINEVKQAFFEDYCTMPKRGPQSKKLKILAVTGTFPRLSEPFVQNQVIGLLKQGHDVRIFADKAEMGMVHKNVDKYCLLDKVYYKEYPEDIDTYDIIICQYGTVGLDVLELKRKKQFPGKIVTFFRGYDITQYEADNPGCYKELLAEGDYFMANCGHFKERAIQLGCDPNRICTIFSTIDTEIFTYKERAIDKTKTIKILSAGRLIEKKGIQDAIPAIEKLIKNNPHLNIEYIIAGDGTLKGQLRKKVYKLGIEKYVTFTGEYTSEQLVQFLNEAHIFLGPSVTASDTSQDACPNVLKESMAVGVPVIGTRHGGIPEIITDQENGLLVNEHDIEGIEAALQRLIDQPEMYAQLAKAGRATVENFFKVDTVGKILSEKLLAIYREEA